MNNEDWKLQVSIRTSDSRDSDMINIRANTADELSVLLEGISDYSQQVAATAKMVRGAYNLAPLGTPASTPSTPQSTTSAPIQGSAPSGGTAYPIVSTVSVPADASLIVVDKTTAIYLMEGTSISVTSGTASGITYTISYEVISS